MFKWFRKSPPPIQASPNVAQLIAEHKAQLRTKLAHYHTQLRAQAGVVLGFMQQLEQLSPTNLNERVELEQCLLEAQNKYQEMVQYKAIIFKEAYVELRKVQRQFTQLQSAQIEAEALNLLHQIKLDKDLKITPDLQELITEQIAQAHGRQRVFSENNK